MLSISPATRIFVALEPADVRSGLWVCAKRLEKGTFGWPKGEGAHCCLRPEELNLLLHGLEAVPRRNWFRR
jgi:transposase